MKENIKISPREFLMNRDETGRLIYVFPETGMKYCVEFIEPRGYKTSWGDVDVVTKKLRSDSYGKHNGGVKPEESLITKENGFDEIREDRGSFQCTVEKMHNEWKAKNGY